jgi:protease PrsW
MDIFMLVALTIGPGIAIAMYIYMRDRFDKEPRNLLLKSFFWGGFSILPAIFIENIAFQFIIPIQNDVLFLFLYTFIAVALTEELCKYFFIRRTAYNDKAFNEPFDGIVYSVMVGMGFATFENIKYVIGGGVETAILRMFMAIPAHAIFGIMMGYFIGKARFASGKDRTAFLFSGILVATVLHGAYDFFLMYEAYPVLWLAAVAVVLLGVHMSAQAIRLHTKASPFNKSKYLKAK